ncbi:MAG: hypothetical protein R2784_09685 [Saprospiraceae bacterium]
MNFNNPRTLYSDCGELLIWDEGQSEVTIIESSTFEKSTIKFCKHSSYERFPDLGNNFKYSNGTYLKKDDEIWFADNCDFSWNLSP